MRLTPVVRTILGIALGILFLSGVVETLELALVTSVNRGVARDPEAYYDIRNRAWFLSLKIAYNTLAAVAAGFLTARIARRAYLAHGLALALLQSVAFAWALSQPDVSRWTPLWMWVALIVLTFIGIMIGSWICHRVASPDTWSSNQRLIP